MKYVIKAPNKKYNGMSATVSFRDGTGNTDSEYLAEWFKKHGYEVIENKPEALEKTRTKKKDAAEKAEPPKEE